MKPKNPNCAGVAWLALAALLFGATLGVVCHHHDGFSDVNCPFCHVSHQSAGPSLAGSHAPLLVVLGALEPPLASRSLPAPLFFRLPSRDPPAL